jgi:hypothetical protein
MKLLKGIVLKRNIPISILILTLILCSFNVLFSQDITAFEIIDNQSIGLTVTPFTKWGMAVADIDRNGYPDILCLRWCSPGYSRIFTNQNGIFEDVTDQSLMEQFEDETNAFSSRTTLWVDYDNDGDKDLSMSTNIGIHLLRNDNNEFTDVSEEVGFVGQIPPGFINSWIFIIGDWADYDLDGDLDCVIAQENNDNLYLFRNDGGVFTNAATEAGLDSTVLAGSNRLNWTDIDLDGDPDLFSRYNIFRNDSGVFTDITSEFWSGELPQINMREFFDYDNDGDLDFFKIVYENSQPEMHGLLENQDGVFVDVSQDLNLDLLIVDLYRSMTIGDFDNDGDQDIFIQKSVFSDPDVLLVNDEVAPSERVFVDIAEFVGVTKTGDRKGTAFFDYDRDGFLDIYLPSAEHNHILYHNLGGNGANWIGFILEGTASNCDAVGSLVTLYTGDKKQLRLKKCGNGFVRQDNPWIHFGIGFETSVDSVVIRWPLGYKQILTDVAINEYHDIKEPDYTSVDWEQNESIKPIVFQLKQNYPNPFNSNTRIDFTLKKEDFISLIIYDMTGREIIDLVEEKREPGFHSVVWDGKNANGVSVTTGVYLCKIKVENHVQSKKIVLIK